MIPTDKRIHAGGILERHLNILVIINIIENFET